MEEHIEQKMLAEQQFMNREYNISHPTYDSELAFYTAVAEGNIELIE